MPFPRATGCQKYQFQYFTDDALTSSGFSIPSVTESLLLKVHNYVLQCSELHSPHPISSLGFAHLVPPLPRLSGVFSPLCLASPLPGPLAVSASWTAHAQHLAPSSLSSGHSHVGSAPLPLSTCRESTTVLTIPKNGQLPPLCLWPDRRLSQATCCVPITPTASSTRRALPRCGSPPLGCMRAAGHAKRTSVMILTAASIDYYETCL